MPKKTAKAKKAVSKKVAKVKAVKAVKAVKVSKLIKEPMSKSALVTAIVESTGLAKKEVSSVLENFVEIVYGHLRKGAAGVFSFPGLMKLYMVKKPAVKARKGVNPFTGEEMMFKAKPARNVVKARVLKKLKDLVA